MIGQPQIAATLTGGSAHSSGVSAPGRRQEDDVNIVIANALSATGVGTCGADDNQAQANHLIPILEVTGRQGHSADSGLDIGKPGDPMVTLQAGKQHAVAYCDDGDTARCETASSQRLDPETENFVCVTGERTHALTSEGADASEDGGGRGTPIVTGPMIFETRVARNGRGAPTDVCPPLKAESGQSGKGDGAPMVMRQSYGVRRLMPIECEKLQGLPPGWTAYGDDGTPLSDAARYRMVGNAGVVDVLVWIARRMKGAMEGALPMP